MAIHPSSAGRTSPEKNILIDVGAGLGYTAISTGAVAATATLINSPLILAISLTGAIIFTATAGVTSTVLSTLSNYVINKLENSGKIGSEQAATARNVALAVSCALGLTISFITTLALGHALSAVALIVLSLATVGFMTYVLGTLALLAFIPIGIGRLFNADWANKLL